MTPIVLIALLALVLFAVIVKLKSKHKPTPQAQELSQEPAPVPEPAPTPAPEPAPTPAPEPVQDQVLTPAQTPVSDDDSSYIVNVTTDGDDRHFLAIRQFADEQRIIFSFKSTDGRISHIRLTCVCLSPTFRCSGCGFSFASVHDLCRFAERAEDKLAECVQPLADKGDDVTETELIEAVMKRFDCLRFPAEGLLHAWERETRYIHQSGVKAGYFTNVAWLMPGSFTPDYGFNVKVSVYYADDALLCIRIETDCPAPDNNVLYRVLDNTYVCDAYATMALQKEWGVGSNEVYQALVDRYAPFGPDSLKAFRADLDQAGIKYVHRVLRQPVRPKQLWHTVNLERDTNPSGYNGEYVPEGHTHDLNIKVSYVEDIIVKVEFEDKSDVSGYWHDNPNYPFSHVQFKRIEISEPTEIEKLGRLLNLPQLSPKAMLDALSDLFANYDDIVSYLDSAKIKYIVTKS